jgi:hypothetical protein
MREVGEGRIGFHSHRHSSLSTAFRVCRIEAGYLEHHCNRHIVVEEAVSIRKAAVVEEVVGSHNLAGAEEVHSCAEVGSSLAGVGTAGVAVLHILHGIRILDILTSQ